MRFNCVAPGVMVTEGASQNLKFASEEAQQALRRQIPAGRLATLEEVAGSVAYLVSDEARYVTGDCLTIDGGWSLGRAGF